MTDENIQAFLEAIAPVRAAYGNAVFNYLAVKRDDDFYLVQARLFLIADAFAELPNTYKSTNIMVGSILFSKIADSIEGFVEQILTGTISIEGEKFIFPGNHSNPSFETHYQPFHPEGIQNQYRLNVLTIRGAHNTPSDPFIKQPSLDWEVMANDIPYGSLQELAYDYQLGFLVHDKVSVEIIAYQVAVIANISQVNGDKAMIAIRLVNNLPKEPASIGYHIQHDKKIIKRGKIVSNELNWSVEDNYLTGKIELKVSEGSVMHCFAAYANVVQQHYWIMDSSKILNPRRAAYEAFDNKLTLLKEIIEGARKNSRDLETAVSCLLWMFGFSVTQIDGLPKMQNPVDLIAATPKGHFIVIECTTGILKEDNKLPKLHERAVAVRKQLATTGNNTSNVLPVLVTSKKHDEIKMELEHAEKHGILVVTREELDAAFGRLIVYPNPDKMYDEALQQVKEAEAKYSQQTSLGI